MNGPEAVECLRVALRDLTEEVASNAYAPEFEHMGPLVIAARTALAAHDQLAHEVDRIIVPALKAANALLDRDMSYVNRSAVLPFRSHIEAVTAVNDARDLVSTALRRIES